MSQVIEYATPTPPIPAAKEARLDSLDLLRGIAILGILLMNTQSMSMPSWAYFDPTYYTPTGEIDTPNYITWAIIHVLADVKLLTIFSMLFGAGIVIQAERVAQRHQSPAAVHYRRMFALLLIGLIHAYALWYGDVLVSYVLCGLLLFPFRRLPPTLLLVAGVMFISVPIYLTFVEEHHLSPTVDSINQFQQQIYGDSLGIDAELKAYRGGWLNQMDNRARLSFANETTWFALWGFWRYGGSMLIGMGLLRTRFFHGEWPATIYRALAALLIPIGWSATIAGILYNESHAWDMNALHYGGESFNYFGSLVTALGYLSAGVLFATRVQQPGAFLSKRLARPFRAIGRTALSNYIMQAIICTTLFYGHGFGWFGHLTRIQLVLVVLCVWAWQMIISTVWLSLFKQGPLEWAWHGMAHGRARRGMTNDQTRMTNQTPMTQ